MVRAGKSDADRAVEVPMARDAVKAHTAAGVVANKARRRTILRAVIVVAEASKGDLAEGRESINGAQ